jgi:hypothetical protein
MRSHASCERRRNPAVIEVELCITDSRFGLVDRCPRRPLIGYALVNVFDRSGIVLFQVFGAAKLLVSQFQSSRCSLKLGIALGECNFVGPSINCEKQVVLSNNVPVLEKYSGKRPPTCARSSTCETAANWPRKLSRVSMACDNGLLTTTWGSGAGEAATVLPLALAEYLCHTPPNIVPTSAMPSHSFADLRPGLR